MTKEIIIEINSTVKSDNGTDDISTSSSGTFIEKDGIFYIFYEEKPEEGSVVKLRITASNEYMELKSEGARTTIMTFTKEKITESSYYTIIGNLDLRIKTFVYDIVVDSNDIRIKLKYQLMSDESVISENKMIITIKPAI